MLAFSVTNDCMLIAYSREEEDGENQGRPVAVSGKKRHQRAWRPRQDRVDRSRHDMQENRQSRDQHVHDWHQDQLKGIDRVENHRQADQKAPGRTEQKRPELIEIPKCEKVSPWETFLVSPHSHRRA